METCRACLSTDRDFIKLNEILVCNYNLLTNLNVMLTDRMPQQFCSPCADIVNSFVEFRDHCILSEKSLQELNVKPTLESKETTSDKLDVIIKGEIKIEVEEDFTFDDPNQFDFDDHDVIKEEDPYACISKRKSTRLKIKKEEIYSTKPETKRKKKLKAEVKSKTKTKNPTRVDLQMNNGIKLTDKLACGLCAELLENKTLLNKHYEEHRKDNKCGLCSMEVNHWTQLLAHRALHLVNDQYCHICDQKFKSYLYLEYHYINKHCEGEDLKLICPQCAKPVSSPRKLARHISRMHSGHKYYCDHCPKIYTDKQQLKGHIIRAHNDQGDRKKTFVCDQCGFSCRFSSGLYAHKLRRHATDKVICRPCGRAFSDSSKLALHICENKITKICPICGKTFKRSFSRHMQTHTDIKKYKCTRCPAEYKSRSALKVHIDQHDGNPTQECEFCHLKFYFPSVLIKHRRTHTGEKPYVCKKCGMGFTGNHNLKVHMKVHGEMLVVKRNQTPEVAKTNFYD